MNSQAPATRALRLRQHYRPSRLCAPWWLRQLWAWF
jgi:hypothetical protein